MSIRIIAVLAALILAAPATAHEFWLEPGKYAPKAGENVPVTLRVGQFFNGATFPYLSDNFVKFSAFHGGKSQPVKGLDGDDPAATLAFPQSGLAVMTFHSIWLELVFEEWTKFETYLKKEGLSHIVARHRAAGKRETNVKEFYARAAKLLIDVGGTGKGADRLTGMPLELVAERNPYGLAKGGALPVRLYYQGKPLADVQITAIAKAEGDKRNTYRTDKDGRALIALPLSGAWLLNAVHMMDGVPGEGAEWQSLWASMIFERR
jgi:uncharacterized GH25 family protein